MVGRKSVHSLYRHELATYEEGDQYDSSAALGFIKIHGLGQTTQAKHQLLRGPGGRRLELPSIIPPVRRAELDVSDELMSRTPSLMRAMRRPVDKRSVFGNTLCSPKHAHTSGESCRRGLSEGAATRVPTGVLRLIYRWRSIETVA